MSILRSFGALALLAATVHPAGAAPKTVAAIDFTATPAPVGVEQILRTRTTSKAVVRYTDGSTTEFPLSYDVLFRNTDRVGSNPYEAGRLYDVDGMPLTDLNGDPVIAETPDANSLLEVEGRLFLVTHYESDWLLGNGDVARKAKGWYSRMPMSMTLTSVSQDVASGKLTAFDQRPIDFASVNGLWIPCFGSQTPWNTHLGAEEDYDLYHVAASGERNRAKALRGLKAMGEVYFKGRRAANPYHYGHIVEVAVKGDGTTDVAKHYAMGRASWEQALVMPDERTVYFGDDGNHVGLFLFVADRAGDLSAGTLYAARWNQTSADGGGAATLGWVHLGHAFDAEVRALVDNGIIFGDIFETAEEPSDGFRAIRAGHSGDEVLRLRPGMETAAAFLESRRYAAYLGATTEFNKMEGVAVDPAKKHLYVAMSYLKRGMEEEMDAPADHVRLPRLNAGATYRIALADGQADTGGRPIDSAWVGAAMSVPPGLLGVDQDADALGNTADPDRVANPDNLFFSPKMRTLFIGEDSGTHVNNFVWAFNVDSGKLTRILSLAVGAEATGLQVVENTGGHAYIMSNSQHHGDWPWTLPDDIRARLQKAARAAWGVNEKGVLHYRLDANVGYIGGIPGL